MWAALKKAWITSAILTALAHRSGRARGHCARVGPVQTQPALRFRQVQRLSVIVAATRGVVHLKTAGTSYLEALRAIALVKPALFRELLALAIERYPIERASYHVSAMSPRWRSPHSVSRCRTAGAFSINSTRARRCMSRSVRRWRSMAPTSAATLLRTRPNTTRRWKRISSSISRRLRSAKSSTGDTDHAVVEAFFCAASPKDPR